MIMPFILHDSFPPLSVMVKLRSDGRFGNAFFKFPFEILEFKVPAVETLCNHASWKGTDESYGLAQLFSHFSN